MTVSGCLKTALVLRVSHFNARSASLLGIMTDFRRQESMLCRQILALGEKTQVDGCD